MYSAYLDRFTDSGKALLLVDSLKEEFLVPTTSLPNGSIVGTWFKVAIQNSVIQSIHIDKEKTDTMKDDIQNQMERLQANKKSRFKRR